MRNDMGIFAKTIMEQKYSHNINGKKETWEQIAYRVSKHVLAAVGYNEKSDIFYAVNQAIKQKKFIPAGRYLSASGMPYHQTQNCVALVCEDSREGWSNHLWKSSMSLMTGAGIGSEYSAVRSEGAKIRRTGGYATGPLSVMHMVNEAGRHIKQGGSRRAASWAGLNWQHEDIVKFIQSKNWNDDIKAMKTKDFSFPAPLDGTNISTGLDDVFFQAMQNPKHNLHSQASSIYWLNIKQMLETGEPGFSINVGKDKYDILRNACTEFVSDKDSDICNLGSVNMARIESLQEFKETLELATLFLLVGTIYSDVPYPKIDLVRDQYRNIGVGIMGIHEWFLQRGKPYGFDKWILNEGILEIQHNELDEVEKEFLQYMNAYVEVTEAVKVKYANEFEVNVPRKSRSIAPTGTIAIIAETTGGIEPLFCAAYKRRYLKGNTWNYQYVIDPIAKNLINKYCIHPDDIEDAYSLSNDIERRVKFQAFMQRFVDHGISSTINLPQWGSKQNNTDKVVEFGNMLLKYLPMLRGITTYPDGARGGQPLTPVSYNDAIKHIGIELKEQGNDVCSITGRGSCGE